MRPTRSLAYLLAFLCGCPSSTDGPTPKVAGVTPQPICIAQKDIPITITGSGFSPAVTGGLTGSPAVQLPAVRFGTTAVAPADVSLPDTTGDTLDVTVRQSLVPPGTYDVGVKNPDGHEGVLAGGLVVDAPPALTSVTPTSGNVGQMVTVTLTGGGFRQGLTVTLDANPPVPGTNVTVSADGMTATATFDLTGVQPGTYSITIDNGDGCTVTLANAFTVRNTDFMLTGIDPPFGCSCSDTTVTITSAGGFASTPTVEMRPMGQATPVTLMKRVAFVDANTITAVVPAGLALGHYDVTVVDPPSDGRRGTLADAFRVVSMPIPTIEQVVPDRAPPATSVTLDVYGTSFRTPGKVELLDRTGTVAATATAVTVASSTHLTATITTPTTQDAYLVRVWDLDEMTYSTWSALIVGAEGASGNLHTFTASSPLVTGRRMLGGVSARDRLGNTYIYAIGGDSGATGAALDTVEVAQLSKFGALGAWQQEKASNRLTTTRDAPAAVAVPLFGTDPFVPVKTYVYVLGGRTQGGQVLGSIERAVVLSDQDAPVLAQPTATTGGTLAAGTWYYKVAAVCSAGDADNPSGETLPSDEEVVTLGATDSAVSLSWTAGAGTGCTPTGYKVYRTKDANGVSQQELLTVTLGNVTTYTDHGDTAGTEPPLPPGALGVWTAETVALGTARWGHQAAMIADGNSSGASAGRSIYVVGGKSDGAAGYLGSVELSGIDANGQLVGFATTGATALATPMAFFSLVVETPQNVSGYTGVARMVTLGGVVAGMAGNGAASQEILQTDVANGGGNAAWAAPFMNATLLTRAGDMAVVASNKLFVLGGAGMATNTSFSNIRGNGEDIAFTNGNLVAPIQSTASTFPAGNSRALGAPITGAGFIYFVGGTSDGSDAVTSTFQTF